MKKNEYKKTDGIHRVHWGKYLNRDEHTNAENFLEKYGEVAFKHIIQMIELTYDDDELDEDVLMDVIHFDDQNVMCQIRKSEYPLLLEKAMDWFIEIENYEMCARIRDLIQNID